MIQGTFNSENYFKLQNQLIMNTLEKENLTGENHDGKHANTPLRYLTASSILGDKVYNRHDQKLGDIKDIMIDLAGGKIEYLVIEFGGFLGVGEKYFAVPFGLLEVDADKEAFILDQSKEVLERAPGFDKDHWPETNSHELQQSYAYWGGFMGANTGGAY
jgi:sporulation protein YlmC with PRC-barrel domain